MKISIYQFAVSILTHKLQLNSTNQFPDIPSSCLCPPHNCEVAARLPRLPRRGGAMSEGLEAGTKAVNSLGLGIGIYLWKSDAQMLQVISSIFKVSWSVMHISCISSMLFIALKSCGTHQNPWESSTAPSSTFFFGRLARFQLRKLLLSIDGSQTTSKWRQVRGRASSAWFF